MIKLQKSTFFNETDTKNKLCEFITNASMLSMGENCKKFEAMLAEKQGCDYAVFLNSGSSANLALIQALLNSGVLHKGDVVAVSALTWATNIMPIIQLGLQPFLVDCEVATLNVSPRTFSQAFEVQPNIKALFLTNTLGLCDDILSLSEFCEKKNILFLEDNCESLGSRTSGRLLGSFSLASTFSFFVGHHISTIEGGAVCTNDENLYKHLVMTRAHGWDRNLNAPAQEELRKKHGVDDFFSKYTFYDLGYNFRPTEINGFLGCNQIEYWDEIVEARERNFLRLTSSARNNPDFYEIEYSHLDTISSFAFPLLIKHFELVEYYKNKFIQAGVEIRPMIAGNMARQPFYAKYVGNPGKQSNAELIHVNSFYFGNNPELTEGELSVLCSLIKSR